ncbi:MAG: cellulase family glycosylhydrolase [Lachnospiraceae bacterium]
MSKKMIALLLVMILPLSFAACGTVDAGESDRDSESSVEVEGNRDSESSAGVEGNRDSESSVEIEESSSSGGSVCIEPTEVQAKEPWYLPISEVGAYNKDIITDEIISGCTLGDISADNLPYWTGIIIENKIFVNSDSDRRWEEYTPGSSYWTEDEIRYQAEQGFNCARILYSFSYLSNPDDIYSINMAELEQLDELLSWCMKYDMHLMLSITGLPGMAGAGVEMENVAMNDTLFTDTETQENFATYWEMISRRYADIPSGALSFELEAEGGVWIPAGEPDEGAPDMERFYNALAPIAKGMWEDRPDRIVIVNDNGKEVPEKLAAIGCCLSLHNHIYSVGENWLGSPQGLKNVDYRWPMEFLPSNYLDERNGSLTFTAESSFNAGSFIAYAQNYFTERPPMVTCDGVEVEVTDKVNPEGTAIWTAQVPEGTKEIVFTPVGDYFNIALYMVELEQEGREKVQICSYGVCNYEEAIPFPTIQVNDDGTTQNLSGQVLDGEYVYRHYLKPFVECAEKYGVSFIMTEVGTDTTVLDPEEYLSYHEMWLDTLKSHNIGWMFNCERNIFAPKELMWLNGENNPIPFKNYSRWEDGPYWINEDVMGLLKAYQ